MFQDLDQSTKYRAQNRHEKLKFVFNKTRQKIRNALNDKIEKLTKESKNQITFESKRGKKREQ